MTKFGNYLHQLRGISGKSLREVSSETENYPTSISHSTIAAFERGKNSKGNIPKPTPDQLKTLAHVFHVPYNTMMEQAGYLPTPTNIKAMPTKDGAIITANVGFERSTHKLDVFGRIAAGTPTFACEDIIGQTVIPDELIQDYGLENLFGLQVNGDSMSRVIAPNFIAVFAKDQRIENGDIVAVLIDGEDATLKRFKETSRAVVFEPDSFNPVYKPIIFPKTGEQNFRILGKYVFATSLLK